MTQVGQKISEWLYARKAGKLLSEAWDIADCESPDFIVTEDGKRFGLEVCQIFTGERDEKGSRSKKNEAENQNT